MMTATERIEAAFPQMAASKFSTLENEWLILDLDGMYFVIRHEGNCKEQRFVLFGSDEWQTEIPLGLNVDYQLWACSRIAERLKQVS
jgi:hypothetical protein